MATLLRQGDVLLRKVEALPAGAVRLKLTGRIVLAEGEATGHNHTLPETAEVYELNGQRWVVVPKASELVHQEHDAIEVAAGTWWIVRQREYSPQAIRRVSD